ncbi:MAG: HNH endonuclease [Dehalococcoidia bacterium]|nr:HNH endonuclease [Dehalococcoidia bacterium]
MRAVISPRTKQLPAWWPACGMLVVHPGHCSLASCDKPLKGRQTRWCSQKCANAFLNQHQWSRAQLVALKRDKYTCQMCGSSIGKQADRRGRMYWRRRNHGMEVNHIAPLNGRGYHIGCSHHLDNLQTLCHDCHLTVTLEQRSERNRRENKSVAILGVAKNLKSFAAGVQRASPIRRGMLKAATK